MQLHALALPGQSPRDGHFIIVSYLPFFFLQVGNSNSSISSFKKVKKFIRNLAAFGLLGILLLVFICLFFKLDGYTDPFYTRFSTPRQTSLIIGTSRGAQGIEPAVINEILKRHDIYNYSFTIVHSPFGATYLHSIENKLKENTHNGIFIVAIDPWSICGPADNPNDSLSFPELTRALKKTEVVDMKPNFFYVLQSYDKPLYNLFSDNKTSGVYLHPDGWLEVTVPMDSISVAERLKQKLADYQNNNLPNYKFSSVRMRYLIKTIEFLKSHGKVYLVRLPMHPKMFLIEDELMPDFDDKIANVSLMTGAPYKNFRQSENRYQFVDGGHLYKTSGRRVSLEIAKWIKAN